MSNADAERLFSKVNLIKTDIRNRLSIENLGSLIRVDEDVKRSGCCFDYTINNELLNYISK